MKSFLKKYFRRTPSSFGMVKYSVDEIAEKMKTTEKANDDLPWKFAQMAAAIIDDAGLEKDGK